MSILNATHWRSIGLTIVFAKRLVRMNIFNLKSHPIVNDRNILIVAFIHIV